MNQENMNVTARKVPEKDVLNMIAEAIDKTSEKYYRYDDVSVYERVFCYELYHQFRLFQDSKENDRIWKELILSGEPKKDIAVNVKDMYKEASQEGFQEEEELRYPDFILHGGLLNIDPNLQIAAIEVKRKTADVKTWIGDLFKLTRLMNQDGLNFGMGVFIVIGMTSEKVKDELENAIKKLDKAYRDKNYCKISLKGTEDKLEEPFLYLDPKLFESKK